MKRRAQRRGILLLIVLSLLVLFVLIGVTFVVVATQYTRAAKAFAKHELKGDDPAKELDGAMYLLMRGTTDTSNLTYRHNLLGDLYGRDGFIGVIQPGALATVVRPEAGGEFYRLLVQRQRGLDPINYPDPRPIPDPPWNAMRSADYYAGCVLTMTDGPSRGRSARILRCTPSDTNQFRAVVVVAPIEPVGFAPQPANRFVVNGRPFNGTGDGLLSEQGRLYRRLLSHPVALLPNLRQAEATLIEGVGMQPQITVGDSDESWDAPDFQNFYLARVPSGQQSLNDPLIPSFHRPFLINYWMHRNADDELPWDGDSILPGNPLTPTEVEAMQLRRWVVARPMRQDHPQFNGSNPFFSEPTPGYWGDRFPVDGDLDDPDSNDFIDSPIIVGPWDVDNDNDGVADSIWVDLGMPAKTSPDGRMYKPLFAILCIDLDGRLNVNAHGSREQLATRNLMPDPRAAGSAMGQAIDVNSVTRGQGYGPAEIMLLEALPPTTRIIPELGRQGISPPYRADVVFRKLLESRLSSESDPSAFPGQPGEDFLGFLKNWGMPQNFITQFQATAPLLPGSAYQTPPDLKGEGRVYLDLAGQPVYAEMGDDPNQKFDHPYETNLVTPNATDSLFTLHDQEQILRYADIDTVAFSGRLRNLLNWTDLYNQPSLLRRFTTHSFDIPTPAVVPPFRFANLTDPSDGTPLIDGHVTLGDLVRARLIANNFGSGDTQVVRLRNANLQVELMLPPEIRRGLRMDVNRWLSNMRDDTGEYAVDEPAENLIPQSVWFRNQAERTQNAVDRFAADPRVLPSDPNFPTHKADPRQTYARHLYCLMMLLIDSRNGNRGSDFEFETAGAAPHEATARRIAQWAINVVDFRDPDAIMTPFEFDLRPFDEDGWSVDDNFTTANAPEDDRAVVWGCEHPELIITESLALHDRRVRDTMNEIADANEPDGGQAETRLLPPGGDPEMFMPDESLDQYRIPQGSLFLELHCVRERRNPIAPVELYDIVPPQQSEPTVALNLARQAGGSPVWRVAIARVEDPEAAVTDPDSKVTAALLPALSDYDPVTQNPQNPFNLNDVGLLEGLRQNGLPDNSLVYERFIVFTNTDPSRLPDGTVVPQFLTSGAPNPRARVPQVPVMSPSGGNVMPGFAPYYYSRHSRRNPDTLPRVKPGEYAVIGPYRPLQGTASVTLMGSAKPTAAANVIPPRISLNYRFNPANVNAKRAVGILVAAQFPNDDDFPANSKVWTEPALTRVGVGVSVSEPFPQDYYDEPKFSGPLDEYYTHYADPVSPGQTLPDVPLDDENDFLNHPEGLQTGTTPNFRVAVLQRLADPTRRWDADTNPYITIDVHSIDLTVFNGEEEREPETNWDREATYAGGDSFDIADENEPEIFLQTRERGRLVVPASQRRNLLDPFTTPPSEDVGTDPNLPTDLYWRYSIADVNNNTLGFLNRTYLPPLSRQMAPYHGDPIEPFPWLVWNNRPYVSHLELMQVPSSSQWRLLYEFKGEIGEPYGSNNSSYDSDFAHLLNFFHSDYTPGDSANLCRILDYLEVPSRFVGTEKWLDSRAFSNMQMTGAGPDLYDLAVPFNKISMYRDPGKVNINSIPDEVVWRGIDPAETTPWSEISASLRGESDVKQMPAFYTNPLAAAASVGMPIRDMRRDPAERTLLRPDQGDEILFSYEGSQQAQTGLLDQPDDNSYFKYHKLQRLGNLVTSHSNVYAIWITVGYFEVHQDVPSLQAVPPDLSRPDGFRLGRELGSDTGDIKRHRAFYMIDRSIPVAYEPGENHNVDKAILLRRLIE